MADRTLRVAPRPEVHHARSFTFMGRFLHVETFSNLRAPHMLSRHAFQNLVICHAQFGGSQRHGLADSTFQ